MARGPIYLLLPLLLLLLLLLLDRLDAGSSLPVTAPSLQNLPLLVLPALEPQVAGHSRAAHDRAPVVAEALVEWVHARPELARHLKTSHKQSRDI